MERKVLYLECNSGISGDMTVAALLDLGASAKKLQEGLAKLPIDGYEIKIGRTKKCGIDSCTFSVILHEDHHHHRTFGDIKRIIRSADLEEAVKKRVEKIFYVLAKAEAKVHGVTIDTVHFHEVGAVDSIVDIVGAAICLDDLGIIEVAVSSMSEGCGMVWCQHGQIPVPVPAVAELAAEYGLPLKQTGIEGEMITPTGAAIVAAMRTKQVVLGEYVIKAIGIGAGTKEFAHANILRAMLIEEQTGSDDVWVLETNVDDLSGEQLGFLQEQLLKEGARDAFFSSIYMKKSRPAYKLTVLCDELVIERMEGLIFRESTSIGIRRFRANRTVLERRTEEVDTQWGKTQIKVCRYAGQTFYYPEYEAMLPIAQAAGLGYRELYDSIVRKAEEKFGE